MSMAQKWFVMCLLCACAIVCVLYALISSLNIWDDAAAAADDDDDNDDITSDI